MDSKHILMWNAAAFWVFLNIRIHSPLLCHYSASPACAALLTDPEKYEVKLAFQFYKLIPSLQLYPHTSLLRDLAADLMRLNVLSLSGKPPSFVMTHTTGHKMWMNIISEPDCYQGCPAAGAQSWLHDVFKVCSFLNQLSIRCHTYLNLSIHVIFIFNGEGFICFHVVSILPAILFVIYGYLLSALIILRLLVVICLILIFRRSLPFW